MRAVYLLLHPCSRGVAVVVVVEEVQERSPGMRHAPNKSAGWEASTPYSYLFRVLRPCLCAPANVEAGSRAGGGHVRFSLSACLPCAPPTPRTHLNRSSRLRTR